MPTHNGRITVPDAKPEAMESPEATQYVRVLDNAQLVGMAVDLQRRAATLAAQGVPLPMAQLENHHLIGLLDCLVGAEESLRVKEWHLMFVDRYFDQIEAEQRIKLLGSGLFDDPADLPGFP